MERRRTLMVASAVVVGLAGVLAGRLATTEASNPSKTFTADADAYVSADKPRTNYGRTSTLVVDGSPVRRAYVRFTVAGLAGPLTRATLRLYAASSSKSPLTASRVSDTSWAEGSLTWSNAPAIVATPTASSPTSFGTGWVTIDVTPLVAGDGVVSL